MEEIQLSADEDITLFTDDEQVAVKTVNKEFLQESKLKGLIYKFTIFNDVQCYQFIKRKHSGKKKFRVNLTYLDPKPIRKFNLGDSWLISAAIFAIISFMMIYAGWFSTLKVSQSLITVLTAIAITSSLISILLALLKTEDRLMFYCQHGRIPILTLINHNPDRTSFADFSETLSSHIISAQAKAGINKTDRLTQELKEIRRLRDEKVISAEQYEQAKKRIFSNSAFKS